MSIATSIEKLSETLTNCKTNLKEKEVADVDNIKISDVDEKIAEIQAGGGGNKATVTFSKGEGNEAYFDIEDNLLVLYREIYDKSVIQINIENSPYDNSYFGDSIAIKTDKNYTVSGSVKNGSGTVTVTFNDGMGYPANGVYKVPYITLILRNDDKKTDDYEVHMLFAQYIS